MRILFVSANPHWTARLDLADELRSMQKSLAGTDARVTLLPAAQLEDLKTAIRENQFDIVHFSGHATKERGLLFRKPDGEKDEVSPAALRELLRDHNIKLAVLNACDTDTTAAGIRGFVSAVIGTTRALDDRAAKLMTKVLYAELARGRSVRQAYDEAKRQISEGDLENVYTPDLAVAEDADESISFKPSSAAGEKPGPEGKTDFDRYFYVSYLDEQISVLDRNIKINKYVFWALIALGIGMLLFDWGQHIAAQNPEGPWEVVKRIFADIGNFLLLALQALVGDAIGSDTDTPFLDWLTAVGQMAPIAIASLQYRWCLHGLEEKREMKALRELVEGSEELDQEVMDRLHKILDQSLRNANTEFRDLREYLPPAIEPVVDKWLDRTLGANVE